MPSPRLIDPAVFFDIVKIRKFVDEAAHDSVRASTGISNNARSGRMDYFGAGGGPSSQLSKERIFKIRQKAVGLLAKAFTLDEVAASVATMQATSTIEDVASHVLKRDPNSNTARYVHFFHEKIPSREMEQNTTIDPLTEIISSQAWEEHAAPLRTRGLTQSFKLQHEHAAIDFTLALRVIEELNKVHKPNQQQLELASKMREQQEAWQKGHKDWRSTSQLKDEDQPKSLELQLLFNRAGVYLTLAYGSVNAALDGLKEYHANGVDNDAQRARLEARKKVKTNAKRALKDYISFLSHFEYTPGLPYEITNEIMSRVYDLAHGRKAAGSPKRLVDLDGSDDEDNTALIRRAKQDVEKNGDGWPKFPLPKIYATSMLFAEKPLVDLPPYPVPASDTSILKEALGSREAVTYHPLLAEALHSLLLAHALLQTSPTELQRHAYNVARLARISDGYPIFQSARSPARADWIEVLNETKDWLSLSSSWQDLCAPAPLPDAAGGWVKSNAVTKRHSQPEETAEQKKQRIKQESILEALSDDRVVDEVTFQKAVAARENRASQTEAVQQVIPNAATEEQPKHCIENGSYNVYPISTERAQAIARWVHEAPLSMGGKKKKPARRKKPADGNGVNSLAESVSTLSVDNDDEVD